ncbi:hypothetical protein [Nocardioides kribbensis]|uniref:hypothetical protein n=1 Tax=Nocardioides kribbensis TaxID=305517 RepID=UPI0032DA6B28
MTSPSAPSVTPATEPSTGRTPSSASTSASASRRRQRSTRLTVATLLLVVAAVVVLAAALSGSWVAGVVAGVSAVLLGAAATRITYSELLQSRRDANRDRAEQAQAYRRMAEERSVEHAAHVAAQVGDVRSELGARLAERETALSELEAELAKLQKHDAETTRRLLAETKRAQELEREGALTARSLDAAEERAAEAIVRMAELEAEIDVLRAEVETVTAAWRSAEVEATRRRRA